jgi:PmbA protein
MLNFDTLKNELRSIADSGLIYAKNKAPDSEIEIFISQGQIAEINLEGGSANARDSLQSGVGVRVFNNKKKSFASTSGFDVDNLHSVIDDAITISNKISFIDERFQSLASHKPPASEGLLDPEIINVDSKILGDEVFDMVKACREYDERIISVTGNRSAIFGSNAIVNTNGVNAASRITVSVGVIYTVAKEGNKHKTSFGFDLSRKKALNLQEASLEASKRAIDLLQSKPLNKSKQMTVLWDNLSAGMYFGTTFGQAITGGAVVEGQSYFADKLGDEVGTSELTVIDDGQLPEGLGTSSIDDEGVPKQKTKILSNGILKSFISNVYYANILGTSPTGNSSRGGGSHPSYESIPATRPTTLIVTSSNKAKSIDEIISEIDNGIYIRGFLMGIGHTNPVTGTMSAISPSPYLIEKGELKYALDPVSVAGNIYNSLKNINQIGDDSKLGPFGVKTPSIAMEGLTITG